MGGILRWGVPLVGVVGFRDVPNKMGVLVVERLRISWLRIENGCCFNTYPACWHPSNTDSTSEVKTEKDQCLLVYR